MDVASSEFHTSDGMYDLDFKVISRIPSIICLWQTEAALGGLPAYLHVLSAVALVCICLPVCFSACPACLCLTCLPLLDMLAY